MTRMYEPISIAVNEVSSEQDIVSEWVPKTKILLSSPKRPQAFEKLGPDLLPFKSMKKRL